MAGSARIGQVRRQATEGTLRAQTLLKGEHCDLLILDYCSTN